MGVVTGQGSATLIDWNLVAKSVGFGSGSDAEIVILAFWSKVIEAVQGGASAELDLKFATMSVGIGRINIRAVDTDIMGKTDTLSSFNKTGYGATTQSNSGMMVPKSKSALYHHVEPKVLMTEEKNEEEETKREAVKRLNKNNLAHITLLSDEFATVENPSDLYRLDKPSVDFIRTTVGQSPEPHYKSNLRTF